MDIKQELVQKAMKGNEAAQNQVFAQLRPFLMRYFESRLGKREEIDDLVQNTLLRIHKSWLVIREAERFMGFVMKAATYELHDLYRGRYDAKEVRYDTEIHSEPKVETLNEGEAVDIEKLLSLLSDKSRHIIALKNAGYPYEEIGQIMGISASAVKMQVKRAFDKIRTFLQDGNLVILWLLIYR